MGFEPTNALRRCQFSRLVPSTTRPPLHLNKINGLPVLPERTNCESSGRSRPGIAYLFRPDDSNVSCAHVMCLPDSSQETRFKHSGIFVPESQIPDTEVEKIVRLQEAILNKLAALPGVTSVGLSTAIPMDGYNSNDPVAAQDHVYKEGELPPLQRFKFISPGFFATLGSPLLAGRDFTWSDMYQRLPVAIVSENFAKQYWHDTGSAIGKRIRVGDTDDWREIIGVARNMHDDGVNNPAPTAVYWPILMNHFEGQKERTERNVAVAIRTPRAGSESLLKEIQQVVWSVDPNLPAGGCSHRWILLHEVHGPHIVHVGDSRRSRRHGASSRSRRHLRRHILLGLSKDAGDRHPHGTGRTKGGAHGHVCEAGAVAYWNRDRVRPYRRCGNHAPDVFVCCLM